MSSTTEDLYDALYRIGSEDGTAETIRPAALNQLVAFKIAEIDSAGSRLTLYGEKCYVVMESGDGRVTEFE